MENASKALIMAGGILIALLIIAVLIYSFGSMSGYFNAEQNEEVAKQLKIFNDQYESYNRKLLRGTDVISVINKVIDNNYKYGPDGYDEPNYIMNVEYEMVEELSYSKNGTSMTVFEKEKTYTISEFTAMKEDKEKVEVFTDFKRRVFDCIDIKYNEQTGRVNYMKFKERQLTEDEYRQGL